MRGKQVKTGDFLMQSTLRTFGQRLRNTIRENGVVQGEATLETLRRFRIFAAIMLAVNLAYIAEFWFHISPSETAVRASWANAVGWAHCLCAATMVVLGYLLYRCDTRSQRSSWQALALQILFCASMLLFAIALSVIDQMVTPNTTNFATICLLVAMTSLMRPTITLVLFLAAYFLFFQALAMTQPDPNLLALARSHSVSAVLMSIVASAVVWRQFVTAVLLRRELVRSHQSIADKQSELEYLATHDTLTGLYNRREFMRLAEMELARGARLPADVCARMVDLDFFKKINDQYGHPAGDAVLQQIAAMLTAGVRSTDVVARMGGEEFIVLLPSTTTEGALALAEKLRCAIRTQQLKVQSLLVPVTVSIGVSAITKAQRSTVAELYTAADQALYAAKHGGRDRVEYRAVALPMEH
jgi:diguanylate cyclase (GGDEF)-like protein